MVANLIKKILYAVPKLRFCVRYPVRDWASRSARRKSEQSRTEKRIHLRFRAKKRAHWKRPIMFWNVSTDLFFSQALQCTAMALYLVSFPAARSRRQVCLFTQQLLPLEHSSKFSLLASENRRLLNGLERDDLSSAMRRAFLERPLWRGTGWTIFIQTLLTLVISVRSSNGINTWLCLFGIPLSHPTIQCFLVSIWQQWRGSLLSHISRKVARAISMARGTFIFFGTLIQKRSGK